MNIPGFQIRQFVNSDGTLHPMAANFLIQLVQELQANLSNEGYKLPPQTTANIALLNNPKSANRILVNSDTQEAFIHLDGTFKKLLTT